MSASQNLQNNNKIVQVVALALRNKKTGEYMLARRGPGSGQGEWEFPGGKIEAGETQTQALIREIIEEMNFDLGGLSMFFLAENTHVYPAKKIQIFLWLVEIDTKPVFALSEHDAVDWYSIEKMKEINLTQGDKYFISLLK